MSQVNEQTTSISVREAVEDFRYGILHLSARTQREYLHKLGVFADWCEAQHITLQELRQAHLRKFVEYVRTKPGTQRGREGRLISGNTIGNYTRILKVFLRWLSEEDGYEQTVSRRLADRLENPAIEEKVVEIFTDAQLKALWNACDKSAPDLRVRNRAILAVLIDTGIRASELCGLILENVYLEPEDAHLKVLGKGNKWREVPLGRNCLIVLRRYITRYRRTGKSEARVFIARGGGPLTVRGLQQVVLYLGKAAKIEGVRCSPHTFRHTFACHFLEETGDIYRLMRLMGHSDIKITQLYLKAFGQRAARKTGVSLLDTL